MSNSRTPKEEEFNQKGDPARANTPPKSLFSLISHQTQTNTRRTPFQKQRQTSMIFPLFVDSPRVWPPFLLLRLREARLIDVAPPSPTSPSPHLPPPSPPPPSPAYEEPGLLGVGAHPGVPHDANGQAGSQGAHPHLCRRPLCKTVSFTFFFLGGGSRKKHNFYRAWWENTVVFVGLCFFLWVLVGLTFWFRSENPT